MLFWVNNGKPEEKIAPKDMDFLEVIAQLFVGKKVAVATCEITANQQVLLKEMISPVQMNLALWLFISNE